MSWLCVHDLPLAAELWYSFFKVSDTVGTLGHDTLEPVCSEFDVMLCAWVWYNTPRRLAWPLGVAALLLAQDGKIDAAVRRIWTIARLTFWLARS